MRWIVDGMNVIGSRPDGWWKDRPRAMAALVAQLDTWAATQDGAVSVVFEQPPAEVIPSETVEVRYAPRPAPNSADDEIVRLVCADEHPEQITVITSDVTLADRVRAAGATVSAAGAFRAQLDAAARQR